MEHVWDAGDKGCGLLVIELERPEPQRQVRRIEISGG